MVARIAILFVGFILFGVFFTLYALAMAFATPLTVIESEFGSLVLLLEKFACYLFAAATTYKLLQPTWSSLPPLEPPHEAAVEANDSDLPQNPS